MVSRRSTGPLRTILPAVTTALRTGLVVGVVALGVAGCSAGQATQTDSVQPAVNGNQGNVGDVALRDVLVAYPESGGYRAGEQAPLTLAIVNTGGTDDELTSVSSPAAASVELLGRGALPARSGLQVIIPEESTETESAEPTTSEPSATESEPSGTESAEPSGSAEEPSESSPILEPGATYSTTPTETPTEIAPEDVGTISLVLTGLTKDLAVGKNVPVTFVFARAGEITLNVPIATPDEAREETAAE